MFFNLQREVFLSPEVLEYSHERQAQKNAAMQRVARAISLAVDALLNR